MAAAGCMEDNSVMDSEEKAENASLDIAEICKKNGASQLLITATISDAKAAKPKKGVKINGAVATPCAPSLRSRRDRLGFDTWRKAKKVTAEDCKDEHFYDQLGKTTCAVKGEPLKNNAVSNSDLATCCQHVSSKKTITESCCKLQNGNVCRNGTPSSTCAKLEGAIVKDQIAKAENGLLKKDKAENCEAKSERGTSCAKTTAKIEKLTARSDHANNKTDKGITKSESTNTKSKEHLKSEILNSKLEKSVTKTEEHLSKTDKGIAKLKLTETQLELECLKSENGNVKSENESIKIEDTTFKGEKPCSPNHKKNLNSLMCGPLKLSSGLECKVKTKVPCHNSNGIHFVVRLQSPTITNTSMSVSNLWRTNSSEFNTPDTSRSSTPQPLFGGCALFSHGGMDAGKVPLEKPVEKPVLTQCKWSKCGESLEPATLMDHIRQSHVDSQADQETFVCLWDSCKVYNKASSSKSWLQRHILCHSGDKPFRCIVDGCQLRFPSQNALERHVNSHFNTLPPPSARSIRSRDDTPTKVCRKKRLKRKRPGKVRTGDFFDSGVMDFIHQDMIKIANKTQLDINSGSNNTVTFQSTVIGRRTDESGKAHILLHYTPEDVLPDCWIPESQADKSLVRTIPIADLPRDSAVNLDQSLYRAHRFRKHRRK